MASRDQPKKTTSSGAAKSAKRTAATPARASAKSGVAPGKAAAKTGVVRKASSKTANRKAPAGPAPPITNKGDPLPRLREICLSLPETTEKEAWGAPTFRVRDKMFAMFLNNHHGDGEIAVWCKAPMGMQESLVESEPTRYFVPAYVGHQGWVGVRLERDVVDWPAVAEILREGHGMSASAKRRR